MELLTRPKSGGRPLAIEVNESYPESVRILTLADIGSALKRRDQIYAARADWQANLWRYQK